MNRRNTILFAVLSIALLLLFILDVAIGAVSIPLSEVWRALVGGDVDPTTAKIVKDIRLVKAVVAVATGVALSLSGLLMQTLFRNPLAGPYVLGISSGASLGVAIFILGAPIFGLAANSVGS
ncbi:MAG: iron chelate uptake ABC transporter family permease subunit, partial [Bacteroidales bacterium]|nr:iron chelate uptake ABC transporter family permease subunit [Bacteroidales bacterium]